MEIKQIKSLLTIKKVLTHYNLKPDRNNRLLCPFHKDTKPSLQIYPATNTFTCFSTNCTAGSGDVIEFIQLKEKCTKHEAILKAKSLIKNVELKIMKPQIPKIPKTQVPKILQKRFLKFFKTVYKVRLVKSQKNIYKAGTWITRS